MYITKKDFKKEIEKSSDSAVEKTEIAKSLIGVIPADITLEDGRNERLEKI